MLGSTLATLKSGRGAVIQRRYTVGEVCEGYESFLFLYISLYLHRHDPIYLTALSSFLVLHPGGGNLSQQMLTKRSVVSGKAVL